MTQNTIIEFEFSELHSYQDLDSLKNTMSKGGVYIWGLIYKTKNGHPFGKPFNNSISFDDKKHMFIPYYIGQSEINLWKCFKDRHNNPSRNTFYLLLSYDYIKKFYKDCHFPEFIGTGANKKRPWFEPNYFKNLIVYYNNYYLLQQLYGLQKTDFSSNNNYPAECFKSILKNAEKCREAKRLELYMNTFFDKIFFCYSDFKTEPKNFNLTYKDFESYVFYRLKGKTISQHVRLEKVTQKFGSTIVNVTSPLNLFKPTISRCFNGY